MSNKLEEILEAGWESIKGINGHTNYQKNGIYVNDIYEAHRLEFGQKAQTRKLSVGIMAQNLTTACDKAIICHPDLPTLLVTPTSDGWISEEIDL